MRIFLTKNAKTHQLKAVFSEYLLPSKVIVDKEIFKISEAIYMIAVSILLYREPVR